MAKLEVSKNMVSGFKPIDTQHIVLLKLVNSLYDFDESSNPAEVKNVIDNIITTAVNHFEFEQALMVDSDYEYTRAYISIHNNLVKRVSKLNNDFNNGKYIVEDLRELLTAWLRQYLKVEANTYVDYIKMYFNSMNPKQAENRINELLSKYKLNNI